MQGGALPSQAMKDSVQSGWHYREKEEEEGGRSEGGGWRSGVRRYHGRLQGRRLLDWAYETVFVVALWLRQENRRFSFLGVPQAIQVRLPDLPYTPGLARRCEA